MDQKKPQGSQMARGRKQSDRNDKESGEPLQLDTEKREQQGGKPQQQGGHGGQHQGGQHQGGQERQGGGNIPNR